MSDSDMPSDSILGSPPPLLAPARVAGSKNAMVSEAEKFAIFHTNELGRTRGSKVAKTMVDSIILLRSTIASQPDGIALMTVLEEDFNMLVSNAGSMVDAYNRKREENIALTRAVQGSIKAMNDIIVKGRGCTCSNGSCSECKCSKKGGGSGMCIDNCSCKGNCCIPQGKSDGLMKIIERQLEEEQEREERELEKIRLRARRNVQKELKGEREEKHRAKNGRHSSRGRSSKRSQSRSEGAASAEIKRSVAKGKGKKPVYSSSESESSYSESEYSSDYYRDERKEEKKGKKKQTRRGRD